MERDFSSAGTSLSSQLMRIKLAAGHRAITLSEVRRIVGTALPAPTSTMTRFVFSGSLLNHSWKASHCWSMMSQFTPQSPNIKTFGRAGFLSSDKGSFVFGKALSRSGPSPRNTALAATGCPFAANVHPSSCTSASILPAEVSANTFSPGARSHAGTSMLSMSSGLVGQIRPSSSTHCMRVSAPWHSYTFLAPMPSVRSQCPSMFEVTEKQPYRIAFPQSAKIL
mmetsp:Transcript_53961/g.125958  ORF Transcript_53961/g.125958 Transcript_53961/m.125958 type:complete len:224 (-) Transcript_53961:318-989(-)